MNKFSILKNLPLYYQNTPCLSSVAAFLQNSAVRFSGIFIKQNNRRFLVLKDGDIRVDLDWEAFSLLRASSNLILSSGAILRSEPGLFMRQESYGNKNVDDLYTNLLQGKTQQVYVISREYSKENILKELNKKYYQYKDKVQHGSIYDLFNKLYQDQSNHPMSIEIGLNIINQYYSEVDKGSANFLDTLMISTFNGHLEPQFIGEELKVDFQKYYQLIWKSQPLECSASNGQKGDLTIEIYKTK